jgi:hypothetical protein
VAVVARLDGSHVASRDEALTDLLGRWHLGLAASDRVLRAAWRWDHRRVARLIAEMRAWAADNGAAYHDGQMLHQPSTSRAPAAHQPEADATPSTSQPSTSRAPAAHQQSTTPRARDPLLEREEIKIGDQESVREPPPVGGSHTPPEPPSTVTPAPHPEATPSPTDAEPAPVLPGWVPAAHLCGGHPRIEVAKMVVRCVQAARGKMPNPERCGTDAGSLLALWRRLGRPPPADLAADFAAVAEWAQLSSDSAAARDIRAEGWAEGRDRSHDVTTLARQDRWASRLDAARAWVEAGRIEVRPTTPTPTTPAGQRAAVARGGIDNWLTRRSSHGDTPSHRGSDDHPAPRLRAPSATG